MNARVTPPLLALIFVLALALSAAGRVDAQAPDSGVQIETVSIDGTTLKIIGKNFGGSVPVVSVNDANASVSSNSDTEIVAITTPLESGVYILKVMRDAGPGGTVVTTLKIR